VFGLLKGAADTTGRIGLAFGREGIALAVVNGHGDRAVLKRCELLAVAAGGGAAAHAAALQSAALPRLPVTAVLNPSEYQLVLVDAPDVPPAEMRAAIRWRLKDAVDIPLDDAVVDVFGVPPQSRGAQGRTLYAVAARRSAVDRCAASLTRMPTLTAVDIPELCLRNLAAMLPAAARGLALLHLGDESANLVLVQGRTFFFSRQMSLRSADSAGAGVDAGSVVLELQRSLDYYERHFDQPPITQILIAPATPVGTLLATDLARETGLEVGVLDLNATLQCATPLTSETQIACLLAVGAALRDERRSL
jgi:MSHA biogenesis protein MshI